MKRIEVVAAVAFNGGRVFAARRKPGGPAGGLWEFPGGKVEPGESDTIALARELNEELGVAADIGGPFMSVDHAYPEFRLAMRCLCCRFAGEPVRLDGHDEAGWFDADGLDRLDWAPADIPPARRAAALLRHAASDGRPADSLACTFPAPGFRPEPAWFDHPSSLHGPRHTLRVMWWTAELARLHAADLPAMAADLALRAALLHDLGRRHDGICRIHGQRAAETKRAVLEAACGHLSDADWAIVARAATLHSLPDQPLGPGLPDRVVALLKDADGLDRVRIGSAPDPRYFRLPASAAQVDRAWALMRAVEALPDGEPDWYGLNDFQM